VLIILYEFFEALERLEVALSWREREIGEELSLLGVLHS
jgi:hypothetical protein